LDSARFSAQVAVVIGSHPLFILAASARVPYDVDQRLIANGLLDAPFDFLRTPLYGIAVPAAAEIVLEGVIDPNEILEMLQANRSPARAAHARQPLTASVDNSLLGSHLDRIDQRSLSAFSPAGSSTLSICIS
jgi:3-octaprenyl-4-hydroxybenzoate carboxy-lyase Rift-related domain